LSDSEESDAHEKIDELQDYLKAASFLEKDQMDQAITAYGTFIDEHCPEWRFDNLYCSLGREKLAIVMSGHAQKLHQKGEYVEAIDLYLSSLNLETPSDAECPPKSTQEGKACHEADTAMEHSHSNALAAIPVVMMDWANTLKQLGDYQEFEDKCESILEGHPGIFNDQQSKATMAQIYSDWASLLRQDESYAAAIDKYTTILSRFADTPNGELAITAIEEIQAEYLIWLDENPAVPVAEFPQEVSRDSDERWSWTIVFKETGGKVGYTVSGSGWIEDAEGDRYGPWGSTLDRGSVEVPPGGEGEDSYWVRGDTFADGYAVITWEGEDEGGHPITIEVRIHLLP
jgi:hypothetical protein